RGAGNFRGLFWAGGIDLPHDLAQFVVEATLSLEEGFWNLVANGATFKSIGCRRTKPGRAGRWRPCWLGSGRRVAVTVAFTTNFTGQFEPDLGLGGLDFRSSQVLLDVDIGAPSR